MHIILVDIVNTIVILMDIVNAVVILVYMVVVPYLHSIITKVPRTVLFYFNIFTSYHN